MTERRARHRRHAPAQEETGFRPRYSRLAAAVVALVVTLVTLLGGLGLLPEGNRSATASDGAGSVARLTTVKVPKVVPFESTSPAPEPTAQATPSSEPEAAQPAQPAQPTQPTEPAQSPEAVATDVALPPGSGTGTRVVFAVGDQRVWLVDPASGRPNGVVRTYLASGSVTDNLDPGTYKVYSRSRWAVGIDDSGEMEYFVRFTRGENAAIGFHSIPEKAGRPLQSAAQLGTPQSHGCIRQALPDARRLWTFAPVGTKVVVTA